MGLEEILSSLRAEAEEESRRLLEEARRRTEDLLDAAMREAELECESYLGSVDAEIAVGRRVRLGRARARLNLEREAVRAMAVERVFDDARSLLAAATGTPEYRKGLPLLLREALVDVEGPAEIRVRPADIERLQRENPGLRFIADPGVDGGVVVYAGAGSIILDNSLGARLDKASHLLRLEVAESLFGDGADGRG